MTLGEKLKTHRANKGLSQEKIAEIVGVSRQAVTKWENDQTAPSSGNLITLAAIYGTSLDELADNKSKGQGKNKRILQSNLTLIAIILQAAALNVCIQPISTDAHGFAYTFLLLFKLIPLMVCSIWMSFNLRYEKNAMQHRKNMKIELLYCVIQLSVAVFSLYSKFLFLGAILLMAVALIYILVVNPKYMNRILTKRKTV